MPNSLKADFLYGNALWDRIGALTTRATARLGAVPFVGRNALAILGFEADDLLVCAIDDDVVARGLVNPMAVEELVEHGVDVRSVPRLHAKVLIFNRTAVIGSMNASENSKTLIEAGIVTTDSTLVASARSFVLKLADGAPGVTSQELAAWKRLWRTAAASEPQLRAPALVDRPTEPFRLLIGECSGQRPDARDRAEAERLEPEGRRLARSGYRTDWRTWMLEPGQTGPGVRYGDWLLDVILRKDTDTPVRVRPPAQVVSKPVIYKVGRGRRAIFHIRWRKDARSITFHRFQEAINVGGLGDAVSRAVADFRLHTVRTEAGRRDALSVWSG